MRYALFSLVVFSLASITTAADWLTLPSTYSHDATGARVRQYAPIDAPEAPTIANFRTSGYTQTRSSLNYGQSADHYHRVEKWGDPVRPYGEWRFPYRPYGTPYPNWGPPFAGFNSGFGNPLFGVGAGFGGGYGGGHGGKPPHKEGDKSMGDKPPQGKFHRFERGFLGDGRWPTDRDRDRGRFPSSRFGTPQASPFNPYPAGPGSPYPVAPYYDGFYAPYRN